MLACCCLDLLESFLDSQLQVGPYLLHAARDNMTMLYSVLSVQLVIVV